MLPHLIYWFGAIADWWTTRRGFKDGATEANPIMAKAIEKLGRDWGISSLKLFAWIVLLLVGASPWAYYLAGSLQLLAALGNFYNLWPRVARFFQE